MSKLIRIMPTRDTAETVSINYEDTLRGRDTTGNFINLMNPRFPTTPINSINDVIRTGAQGFIGSQESTPLQFQAATGFANAAEFEKLNINDAIQETGAESYLEDPGYKDLERMVGGESEIDPRYREVPKIKTLRRTPLIEMLNDPANEGVITKAIRSRGGIGSLEGGVRDYLPVEERGLGPATDAELRRLRELNQLYPENTGFQGSVEVEVDNLLNKIKTEAMNGIRYTYETLSNPIKREILTLIGYGLLFDFLANPGFSIPRAAFELGGELYNTGLKAYEDTKNMYDTIYNWFTSKGDNTAYNEKDLSEIGTILRREKGKNTPLDPEIRETLKDVKKAEIKYGGTAYEADEKNKYYESAEYKELRDRLRKLYKDVTTYREGPITRAGYLEPTGALTPEANSQVPFGMNINQRLTPAEMKELRRRQKLKSKTIKEFYGEAPELNQSIEPAVTHNNNPTQGPIFDIPDSSPRQMQAAVLNPQDIINQMRAGKQKKSKKVKQTSILGVERSTKESTKAQTSRRV